MDIFYSRYYCIIPIEEVENIDFDKVLQDSAESLVISKDATHTFVKFDGDTPDFLDGKTLYTKDEFVKICKKQGGMWRLSESENNSLKNRLEEVVKNIGWSKYNPFNWLS